MSLVLTRVPPKKPAVLTSRDWRRVTSSMFSLLLKQNTDLELADNLGRLFLRFFEALLVSGTDGTGCFVQPFNILQPFNPLWNPVESEGPTGPGPG